MTDSQDIVAKVALETGIRIKPLSLAWVTQRILEQLPPDAALDTQMVANALPRLAAERPDQFGYSVEQSRLSKMTSSEKHEHANAEALSKPKRERRNATPAKQPLTAEERKRYDALGSSQKLDFANDTLKAREFRDNVDALNGNDPKTKQQ